MDKLVGAQEIADLFGVSRQRVHQWRELPDFPKPVSKLAMGLLWYEPEVLEWGQNATPRRLPINADA